MIRITRPKENQNLWNFILSVFFLCALIFALWEIWGEYGDFPQGVVPFDALLMALAAFRITRLVVYDKIMRWFRELFIQKREFEKDGEIWLELVPYKTGLLATIYDLLGCPWCVGFWSALIIAFVYFIFPWAWFVIFFLALAGAGSFIQLAANAIGWRAENLKLDSHDKEAKLMRDIDLASLGK
jgi:hypothetical protein